LRQVAEPERVVEHAPAVCGGCGAGLAAAPVVSSEARQVFDLPPIALQVVEHRLQHRRCGCGTVTMAGPVDGVPAGVGAPAQYGPGVRAVATYLAGAQHLPLARTADTLLICSARRCRSGSSRRCCSRPRPGSGRSPRRSRPARRLAGGAFR